MSRFERASHVIWHCQYHLVWVPKYRFRMLQGPIGREVQRCVMTFCQQLGCQIVEMNVQVDHVHLLVKVPPRVSIPELMGVLKGRTAIRLFNEFPSLRKKPYWAIIFGLKDTVWIPSDLTVRWSKSTSGSRRRKSKISSSFNWSHDQADLLRRAARCAPLWGASGKTAFYERGCLLSW